MTQLQAMLLSLALEVPVALLVARLAHAHRGTTLLAALLATTITHPLVWHLNHTWFALDAWPRLAVLEVGAVVVEGFVYLLVARLRPLVAWGTSLAANATSFGLGLVLFYWLGR